MTYKQFLIGIGLHILNITRFSADAALVCGLSGLLLVPASTAFAQNYVTYLGSNNGDWWTDSNWPVLGGNGKEPLAIYAEHAVINNSSTVIVARAANPASDPDEGNPGGIELGPTIGTVGGLRIAPGGKLIVEVGTFQEVSSTGVVTVGDLGEGRLSVLGGGTLQAVGLTSGGAATSSITLGDGSGLKATVTVQSATLGRTTRVIGPTVDFVVTNDLTLLGESTLIAEITSNTAHSPLKSPAVVNLDGTFRAEFDGLLPAVGNKWDIVDAAQILGDFAIVGLSALPALGAGQSYQLIRSNGGTNGNLLQLCVCEIPEPVTFLPLLFGAIAIVGPHRHRSQALNQTRGTSLSNYL